LTRGYDDGSGIIGGVDCGGLEVVLNVFCFEGGGTKEAEDADKNIKGC
jgi:hypothetical protein